MAMSTVPAAASVVFWIKNVALGAVLGGALTSVVYVSQHRHSPPLKPEQPSSTRRAPLTAKPAPASLAPIDAGAEAEATSPGTLAQPSLLAPASSIAKAAAVPSSGPSQISRETGLLERARQQLVGDAKLALSTLEQHRREFPDGALQLEREFLAVDALLRLGRQGEAQRRATQLQAMAPGSIYEQRLTQLLNNARTPPEVGHN
jgi:hypothetical protein